MPKLTNRENVRNIRNELSRRTNAIKDAIAKGTVKTKEDAQQLLEESKKPISDNGMSKALTTYSSSIFKDEYTALMQQISRLNSLPSKVPVDLTKAKQRIREGIDNFILDVKQIEEGNAYQNAVGELENNLNLVFKTYCEEASLTKESLSEMVGKIAEKIAESEPNFEPKLWHTFADLALTFVNSIVRTVGAGNMSFKLFREQRQEAGAVNQVIADLKQAVDSAQPSEEVSCNV